MKGSGKPKFSITWNTDLGHDYEGNNFYHADPDFLDFFRDNQKHVSFPWARTLQLDNAFFIVMGDHGLRFGEPLETEMGQHEANNPAFFMMLPKALRNSSQVFVLLLAVADADSSQKSQGQFQEIAHPFGFPRDACGSSGGKLVTFSIFADVEGGKTRRLDQATSECGEAARQVRATRAARASELQDVADSRRVLHVSIQIQPSVRLLNQSKSTERTGT